MRRGSAATAGYLPDRPTPRRARRSPIRPAVYLLLLLAPVVSATWALGELAAARERARNDAQLRSALQAAVNEWDDTLSGLRASAESLAAQATVQRAIVVNDRHELRRLETRHPAATFTAGARPPPNELLSQSIRVRIGGRVAGTVTVAAPLDAERLGRLRRGAGLRGDDMLAIVSDRTIVHGQRGLTGATLVPPGRPADVHVDGRDLRVASVPLSDDSSGPHLAALRTHSALEAASADVRRRAFVIGAVALFALAPLAYAFAPTFARGRTFRRNRAQASRLLAQLADGVFEVDHSGTVSFWNPAAERIAGVRAADVLGRSANEVVPGWSQVGAITAGADYVQAETVRVQVAGAERLLSVSAVTSEEGTVYAFRDLTDERRLETMRRELIGTLSHELRTPLASVYGAALTLRSGHSGEEMQPRLVDIVAEQSEQLSAIVDQILLAGELLDDRVQVRHESFDVEELVGELVERTGASTTRVKLVTVASRKTPHAIGDVERARQIVAALLDNAVKYSPDGGTVGVGVEADAKRVRISVSDEGLGIPAAELGLIFEKFYRLDPDMRRGVGGSGLGLYIARSLAELMGGRLTVESAPGKGSTFTLELPCAPGP